MQENRSSVLVDRSTGQRILAAARQHFFAHGFRGVTMDDLAAELGMSKKTLYAHFHSKTALVEAILLDKFHALESELIPLTSEEHPDFAGALRQMLAHIQRHTDEIKPPFIRDIQRECPELFRVVESRRRDVIQRHFGKLLNEGRRKGLVRRDIPVYLIIEILLAAVQMIMNPPRMLELNLTPKSGATAIISVVLEGVITPEGRSKLWPATRARGGD
jgi:AcrR family transcriptional regulator